MSNLNFNGPTLRFLPTMEEPIRKAAPLFVDDWSIEDTLGEGAFGEVKLLVHRTSGQAVAMKIMDMQNQPSSKKDLVRKEICIHRLLKAPNIIRFYGDRKEADFVYIFLEYAPGGALYDHIDPNTGMSCWEAQKYFKELLAGVEYMHSIGIVHRDIKPENLLLDNNGTLKICDFGLATKFRHLGKERVLDSRCGTLQYIAPEVINRKYLGQPADIWSCGIVLVAMLAGDVPWAEATLTCPEYVNWTNHKSNPIDQPWIMLDTMALSLVRNLLTPQPKDRYVMRQILEHRWMSQNFERVVFDSYNSEEGTSQASTASASEDVCMSDVNIEGDVDARVCASQPLPPFQEEDESYTGAKFSFSQPTDVGELLLSTQGTQCSQDPGFQNLVRRMTRFFVSTSCESALDTLRNYLEKASYRLKRNDAMITITTQDRMQNPLIFKATALSMGENTLLDFRLSKGCGLAFKRRFAIIKASLSKIVLEGMVPWPISAAANST